MLAPELKTKYSIQGIWKGYHRIDHLFSGSEHDPSLIAQDLVWIEKMDYWDIAFTIGENLTLTTHVIEFKTKEGYEMYIRDKVLIFDTEQ